MSTTKRGSDQREGPEALLDLRGSTRHIDMETNLRSAYALAQELWYTLEQPDGDPDFDVDYAHQLARRVCKKLEYLDEDIRAALEREQTSSTPP